MLLPSWPAAKVAQRKTAALQGAERNARTHSPEQVQQIVASIREWGWTQPILVDENDRVIAGHGRLEAAKSLGLEHVPVVVARGWTEVQKRAYLLADNKLALNAGWDEALLAVELKDLSGADFDLSLIGFNDNELAGLLGDEPAGAEPDPSPGTYSEQYGVIVICRDEAQQRDIYERLHAEGLTVKVVAT